MVRSLQNLDGKLTNDVYARLAAHQQQLGETLDEYLLAQKHQSGNCNYQAVSAENYEEAICESFISGLRMNPIYLQLLQNQILDLITVFDKSGSKEPAEKSSESFNSNRDIQIPKS